MMKEEWSADRKSKVIGVGATLSVVAGASGSPLLLECDKQKVPNLSVSGL
jgi:hypothetical protein